MTTHIPQQASDFSPEDGLWFCEECWQDFQGDDCDWLTIVEDKREGATDAN